MALHDLIEQTSTTTGTGAYSMATTPDGRRAWSAIGEDSVVPYAAVDDAGGFEFGIGLWSQTGGTLTRTAVLKSSNSDNAVNWAAGTRRVYVTPFSSVSMDGRRHNIGGMDYPSSGDDETLGYGFGSFWVADDGSVFICRDPTEGNAVWGQPLMANSQGGLVHEGYLDLTGDEPTAALGSDVMQWDGGSSGSITHNGCLGALTLDEDPVSMEANGGDFTMDYNGDGIFAVDAFVVACGENDYKIWTVRGSARNDSSTVTLGTSVVAEVAASAGASSWDVDVIDGGTALEIQVTGAVGTAITWHASVKFLEVFLPSF